MRRKRNNGLSKGILLALLDNHKMSNVQLARYLNVTLASINQGTYALRQKGLITRQGWARFVLTDTGKMECSRLLPTLPEVIEEKVEDITSEPETIQEADEGPEVCQDEAPQEQAEEIDWQREYIKLANAIANRQ